MDFNEYQKLATRTVTFDDKSEEYKLMYLALGIAGEAGEVAEKIKKVMRNDNGALTEEKRTELKKELGDVLWYLSQMARVIGVSFDVVAQTSIDRTWDRWQRGVTKSQGDNR